MFAMRCIRGALSALFFFFFIDYCQLHYADTDTEFHSIDSLGFDQIKGHPLLFGVANNKLLLFTIFVQNFQGGGREHAHVPNNTRSQILRFPLLCFCLYYKTYNHTQTHKKPIVAHLCASSVCRSKAECGSTRGEHTDRYKILQHTPRHAAKRTKRTKKVEIDLRAESLLQQRLVVDVCPSLLQTYPLFVR